MLKYLIFILFLIYGGHILSQDTLTIGEVFDFEIGDEIHYRYDIAYPSWEIHRHTIQHGPDYSATGDTVYYFFYGDCYSQILSGTWKTEYFNHFGSLQYEGPLDSSIFYYLERMVSHDSLIINYDSIVTIDTTLEKRMEWCDRNVNTLYYDLDATNLLHGTYTYAEGLGLVYSNEIKSVPFYLRTKNVFYYKKGNETCGTPDLTTGVKYMEDESVKIFPNPVNSVIHLRYLPSSSVHYVIINTLGMRMRNGFVDNSQISVQDLPKGRYYLILEDEDERIVKGFVKN